MHIEVQGDAEDVFARRMFSYHYRLFDRYGKPLASLAVLADDNPKWRPESFGYELFGCRMNFDFPMVKLLDWESQLDTLLESDNAVALVTAAHLLTKKTRGDVSERYSAKIRLIRILFDRGWERQRIVDFFTVLDWLIRLPDNLEAKIFEDIRQIEEERQMQYVTSIERIAQKKGMSEGLQQGMQEGILEGIEDLMEIKFGEDSLRLIPAIGKIKDVERLREIRRIIKQSKTLDEVEQKIVQ
ncbi:MAG: cytosolic protein [Desulfonatronovibrio sp.]